MTQIHILSWFSPPGECLWIFNFLCVRILLNPIMLGITVVQESGVVRAHGDLEVTAPSTRDLYFQILELKVENNSFHRDIGMYIVNQNCNS